jgi:hypothetical protein
MGILGSVRMHGVRGTGDAAQIGISHSQVFTTARGFAGKKNTAKKWRSCSLLVNRCVFCDTKCRATGRKLICVTQTNRFSIRNTFCFRAVLLRPWSRAPSLSSRPKNARFACRYRPGVCTCSTRVHVLHPGGLHAGPRAISNLVETQRSAGRKTNS